MKVVLLYFQAFISFIYFLYFLWWQFSVWCFSDLTAANRQALCKLDQVYFCTESAELCSGVFPGEHSCSFMTTSFKKIGLQHFCKGGYYASALSLWCPMHLDRDFISAGNQDILIWFIFGQAIGRKRTCLVILLVTPCLLSSFHQQFTACSLSHWQRTQYHSISLQL